MRDSDFSGQFSKTDLHSSTGSGSVRDSSLSNQRYRVRGSSKRGSRRSKKESGLDGLNTLHLKQPAISEDICSLITLALPIILTMIPWVFMKTTESAVAGHLGTTYLTIVAMSELWTSATGVLLNGSVLSVFVSKAVAAGEPSFAGEWLQVSLVVVALASVFVAGAWASTGEVLSNVFHVDQNLADKAQYYAWVFMIAIPARVVISHLTQFYQARQYSGPSVIAGLLACLVNLFVSVVVVLGYPLKHQGQGFMALPIVPVAATYFQLLILVLIAPRMEEWPGWKLSHITKHRVVEYSRLYYASAFSSASDWWRMAVVGVIAAHCGNHALAVFFASYRLLWISLIFTGSISASTGIKLTIALNSGNGAHAKTITVLGILVAIPIILLFASGYYFYPEKIALLFTNNQKIIDEFVNLRVCFSAVIVLMNFQVILERIPLSMNRSNLVNSLGLVSSWVVQVPAVIILTNIWRNDIVAIYTGVAIGYAFMDLVLVIVILNSDFELCSKDAMQRALGYLANDSVSSVSSASKSGKYDSGKYDSGRFRGPVGELERIASMDGSNHRTPFTTSQGPLLSSSGEFEEAFLQSKDLETAYDNAMNSNGMNNNRSYIPPPPPSSSSLSHSGSINNTSGSERGTIVGKNVSIDVTIDDEGKIISSLKQSDDTSWDSTSKNKKNNQSKVVGFNSPSITPVPGNFCPITFVHSPSCSWLFNPVTKT